MEVTIEKLVYGGKGIARHDGKVIFVPNVLPGETVNIDIKRKRKGFLEAELKEVIKPSPDRTAPLDADEEKFTGASWHFISYPAQLKIKEEIIREVFRKIGKVAPKDIFPVIPSPETEHYRLRVQFNVKYAGSRPMIGFYRAETHNLIEIKNAFLLHPLINRILDAIRKLADRLPPLKEIHVNMSPEGEAVILFFINMENPPSISGIFDALKNEVNEIAGITSFADRKKFETLGRNYIELKLDEITYRATEGNFFQVNWRQNKNVIDTVLKMADLKGKEKVLDLYCGIGNFTLPFAKRAGWVIGIEGAASSIEDAKINSELNQIDNVEFMCDTVRRGLKWLLQRGEKPDIIILDPPRAGATKKEIERIIALAPERIIYVSCNPTTLARDMCMLAEGGYRLTCLQPIDMFPNTYHIETVAEMVRG